MFDITIIIVEKLQETKMQAQQCLTTFKNNVGVGISRYVGATIVTNRDSTHIYRVDMHSCTISNATNPRRVDRFGTAERHVTRVATAAIRYTTLWVNSFMRSPLQRVSFYLHYSLDVNKDKMTLSAAVTA